MTIVEHNGTTFLELADGRRYTLESVTEALAAAFAVEADDPTPAPDA